MTVILIIVLIIVCLLCAYFIAVAWHYYKKYLAADLERERLHTIIYGNE